MVTPLGALDDDVIATGRWRRLDGVVVIFSLLEHRVLAALWRAREAVFSMEEIINDVHAADPEGGPDNPAGAIHQALSTLRDKLEGCDHRLVTVTRRGYCLIEARGGVIGGCKLRERQPPTAPHRQRWKWSDAAREARKHRRLQARMKGSKE